MKKKITTVDSLEVAKFSQLATQWWDTEGPLKTLHDINPARLEFIQKFTTLAGYRILDVGCGGGILSEAMAASGAHVIGLDVEADVIAVARLHANTSQLTIDYVCQPIEEFEADSFDIVTCMEMLEHVTEPQLVIDHCARLLKPGGYLFLSTINRTPTAYATAIIAAEYIFELLPRQTHDFDKFIKPSELAGMVRGAGLETIGLAGMAYNPLTRTASLQNSVAINYLLACSKGA